MRSLTLNKFGTYALLIVALMLSACNSGTSPSTASKTSNWSQITGGANAPKFVGAVYGLSTTQSIIMSDQSGYIWSYSNGNWAQLTNGGSNQPESLSISQWRGAISGIPTATSMVMVDNGNLWTYNGELWTSLTGGVNQPESNVTVFGLPTPESIVMTSYNNSTSVLWTYSHDVWESLNGDGNSAPANSSIVYGIPTPESIVVVDYTNYQALWAYSNGIWESLTGMTNGPDLVADVYGSATPNSIVMKDDNNTLWAYTGNNNWESLTGGSNEPPDVATVYGLATPETLVMKDSDGILWTYTNKKWESITGGGYGPQDVFSVFGTPTPESIVMIDNTETLWTYNNGTWDNVSLNQFPVVWYGVVGLSFYNSNTVGACATRRGLGSPYGCGSDYNQVFGLPVPDYIVMTDINNFLWTFDGSKWSQQANDLDAPENVQYVAGLPTTESMVEVDGKNQLWIFNNN